MTRKGRLWTGAALTGVAVAGFAAWHVQNPIPELPLPSMKEAKLVSKDSYWPAVCDAGPMEIVTRTYSLDHEGDLLARLSEECAATSGCEIDRNLFSAKRLDFRIIGENSTFQVSRSQELGWIIEKYTTIIHQQPGAGQAWM